jgi:V/A-type H+-transporting ATPase subunit C
MATASFEEFIGIVSASRYWSVISDVVKEQVESLSIIELRLDKYLSEHVWKTSTSRPLTILPILGYMLSKYVEVENIRAIARGKEAGLSQEAIKDHLVL